MTPIVGCSWQRYKRRGRWLAVRSALRYEEHGKLLRHLRMVLSEQLLEARAAARCLPTTLRDGSSAACSRSPSSEPDARGHGLRCQKERWSSLRFHWGATSATISRIPFHRQRKHQPSHSLALINSVYWPQHHTVKKRIFCVIVSTEMVVLTTLYWA